MARLSNDESRELAEKVLKVLSDREPTLAYKALMYATLSLAVHNAKNIVGEGNVSWPDQFRAQLDTYVKNLQQHGARTAKENDNRLSGVITSLANRGVLLPPGIQ